MKPIVAVIVGPLLLASAYAAEPRVLVDGYQLELVAREPDIVTPIGMAFDARGRLLVIESHTHQRPEDYDGPSGDRVRMLSDSDGDGKLDRWSTFAEGFQQAMNLCPRPDGGVYLVTRRDVRLLEDADQDGRADKDAMILRLETTADYPHNGLSGIELELRMGIDAGYLFVGLGENFGAPYRLVGSDGVAVEGAGGVGTIFQCSLNGAELQPLSSGFWNPFSICRAGEVLLCVDNDPDASPPCRLIEVLPAGDYGHRWEYGRAGVHPLQSWNGELPGSLPMICGTGEAPTALVYHHGYLWVTSWGDHRIERYDARVDREVAKTLSAARKVVVQGDAEFRPTGAAIAPDGSLYFSDWVDRSYPVHGRGRIWRLQIPNGDEAPRRSDSDEGPIRWEDWDGNAIGLRQACIFTGKNGAGGEVDWDTDAQMRIARLQSHRWRKLPDAVGALRNALASDDADVRLYAVRWIADERIAELGDDVARLLDREIPSERYFLAVLAAIDWLDGDATPRTSGISDDLLQRELANASRSPKLHALALRLISPDDDWLTLQRMREYLSSESAELRLEAVRTLAMRTNANRFSLLAEIAQDSRCNAAMRAEAVVGLAADIEGEAAILEKLAGGDDALLAHEARRALALGRERRVTDQQRPAADNLGAWYGLLGQGGDAGAGRRLFFMPNGPQCANCHQHGGRGGRVGPDLTHIGRQQSRERIIASILQPSREVAPHYQAWTLLTDDGLSHAGLRLPKAGDDGQEIYADANGREFTLRSRDIELRQPSDVSIMPDGLEHMLTVEDLRDLVAFLAVQQ